MTPAASPQDASEDPDPPSSEDEPHAHGGVPIVPGAADRPTPRRDQGSAPAPDPAEHEAQDKPSPTTITLEAVDAPEFIIAGLDYTLTMQVTREPASDEAPPPELSVQLRVGDDATASAPVVLHPNTETFEVHFTAPAEATTEPARLSWAVVGVPTDTARLVATRLELPVHDGEQGPWAGELQQAWNAVWTRGAVEAEPILDAAAQDWGPDIERTPDAIAIRGLLRAGARCGQGGCDRETLLASLAANDDGDGAAVAHAGLMPFTRWLALRWFAGAPDANASAARVACSQLGLRRIDTQAEHWKSWLVFAECGGSSTAVAAAQQALDLGAPAGWGYVTLAHAHRRAGNTTAARRHYRDSLQGLGAAASPRLWAELAVVEFTLGHVASGCDAANRSHMATGLGLGLGAGSVALTAAVETCAQIDHVRLAEQGESDGSAPPEWQHWANGLAGTLEVRDDGEPVLTLEGESVTDASYPWFGHYARTVRDIRDGQALRINLVTATAEVGPSVQLFVRAPEIPATTYGGAANPDGASVAFVRADLDPADPVTWLAIDAPPGGTRLVLRGAVHAAGQSLGLREFAIVPEGAELDFVTSELAAALP